jgi:hypothetical protein
MLRWKPKFKFKIKRIYISWGKLKIDYETFVKQHSWSNYELSGFCSGGSLKNFLKEFYYAKIKHEIFLSF